MAKMAYVSLSASLNNSNIININNIMVKKHSAAYGSKKSSKKHIAENAYSRAWQRWRNARWRASKMAASIEIEMTALSMQYRLAK